MVIKPNNEGSSIGVKICKNLISLKKSSDPAAKAIKPSDKSNMNSISFITVLLIKPKILGPINTPTTIKPVTRGRPNFLSWELRWNEDIHTIKYVKRNNIESEERL